MPQAPAGPPVPELLFAAAYGSPDDMCVVVHPHSSMYYRGEIEPRWTPDIRRAVHLPRWCARAMQRLDQFGCLPSTFVPQPRSL